MRFYTVGFAVFLFAFIVRITALGAINQVVFDEVHFGKFISSYCCTHERFFDIHPPIGKLLIAGGAYLAGYDGQFSFEHIGQPYEDVPIAGIRMVPAIFGALLPVIIMILLLQAGVSLEVSFVGGVAVALENALLVESRFILTDSILLTSTFGCVSAAIAAVQTKKPATSWIFVCIAGILAGIAVGTKFTGAIGGALVVCVLLFQLMRDGFPRAALWSAKILTVIMLAIATYLIGWVLHFSLLTLPGSGDVWGVPTGNFWQDFTHTHRQMLSANYNLTADHPYGSKWYTWPFMVRSVFYWQGEGNRFLYLLGNPIVWWESTLLSGVGLLYAFTLIARGIFVRSNAVAWIFLLGYIASFVPLMRVPRVLFLYHYLTPLLFSLLFGIWWLDRVARYRKKVIAGGCLVLIVAGFLFVSPLTYGFPVSQEWQGVLFYISSWR